MRRTRFCILTTARSGSTFLCELLDSVPGVICQGELFHKRSIHQARRHRLDLQTSLEERDRDPVGFLHRLEGLASERWPETATSGFKPFLTHNDSVLRHVVSDADYRIVFLRRKNVLAQYSSNLLAKQAGRWASRDPHPPRAQRQAVPNPHGSQSTNLNARFIEQYRLDKIKTIFETPVRAERMVE